MTWAQGGSFKAYREHQLFWTQMDPNDKSSYSQIPNCKSLRINTAEKYGREETYQTFISDFVLIVYTFVYLYNGGKLSLITNLLVIWWLTHGISPLDPCGVQD